jgi:hypothetical protein
MRHYRMAFGIIAHVQKKSKGLIENEYIKNEPVSFGL